MNTRPSYPFYTADKAIEVTRLLGVSVKKFLDGHDALMAAPASMSRGASVAKLCNDLQTALVMWGIDMSTLDSSKKVDQLVREALESGENTHGDGI